MESLQVLEAPNGAKFAYRKIGTDKNIVSYTLPKGVIGACCWEMTDTELEKTLKDFQNNHTKCYHISQPNIKANKPKLQMQLYYC